MKFFRVSLNYSAYGGWILILVVTLLAGGLVHPAQAATLVVMNTNDSGAGSLRQAIADAAPGDTITFDASLSGRQIKVSTPLIMDKSLTLDGGGNKVYLNGNWAIPPDMGNRIMNISPGVDVLIDGIIFYEGSTNDDGGGIYNEGNLEIVNSTFFSIYAKGKGGAIYNSGNLVVRNTQIRMCTGKSNGGGIFNSGSLEIINSYFEYNRGGDGGAVYNDNGLIKIFNSTFDYNVAELQKGAGIYNMGDEPSSIIRSTFINNKGLVGSAVWNSGTLYLGNDTFYKNNRVFENIYYGHGTVYNSGEASLVNLTFEMNAGGAVRNYGDMELVNSILSSSLLLPDCVNGGSFSSWESNLVSDGSCNAGESGSLYLEDLADNGGLTKTIGLQLASPAVDAGNSAYCQTYPVNNIDQRGVSRSQGSGCDIGAYEVDNGLVLESVASYDGGILEITEIANTGGFRSADLNTFKLGDSNLDQQFRAILHFNTDGIPDGAVVTEAVLKIRVYAITGTNPFTTHGNIVVDIRKGYFYGNPVLQLIDFKAWANMTFAGIIRNDPVDGWYSAALKEDALKFIDTEGTTQLRLWFFKDDNDDMSEDYIQFFSGNTPSDYKPVLIVTYYVP